MTTTHSAYRRITLLAVALTLLSSCGDAVLNAVMDPEANIPLRTEGDWQGRTGPAVEGDGRPCPLANADIRLEVRGATVTGHMLSDRGQRIEIRGDAWAGADHTGRNQILAKFWSQERSLGDFYLEPRAGMGTDHMSGRYISSGSRNRCSGHIAVTRVQR